MIATTIEQSRKLIELGIDVNTADMYYNVIDDSFRLYDDNVKLYVNDGLNPDVDWKNVFSYDKILPAWSLSKLLELMPFPSLHNFFNNKWRCDIHYEDGDVRKFGEDADSPLDATFQMVCYLLENKMIK